MKNTKLLVLAASAALVASLGLVACGGGSSIASSSAASAASESGSAAAVEASSESAEAAESGAGAEASEGTSAEATVDVSQMSAWMGASDLGETFYYAESADGTQGVMVVMDEDGNYVSFVGDVTNPQENYVTITDFQTGNSLTFEVTAADEEGNVAVDLGEQGKAVLASCSIDEVMNALQAIDTYGNAIA